MVDFCNLAAAAALSFAADLAQAQPFPSRPITVIVPCAAGGPADALARILGERMRSTLGQTIVVENFTGASGTIALTRSVKSPRAHRARAAVRTSQASISKTARTPNSSSIMRRSYQPATARRASLHN